MQDQQEEPQPESTNPPVELSDKDKLREQLKAEYGDDDELIEAMIISMG